MATKDDLQAAFPGKAQANRKYLAFAKKAEGDGFPQVAKLFRAGGGSRDRSRPRAPARDGRGKDDEREPSGSGSRREFMNM